MKMRSIQSMALWFAITSMASSVGLFADLQTLRPHHRHHHIVIPPKEATTLINAADAALSTIVRDLNLIFLAESFYKAALDEDSPVANFVAAQNGPGVGSIENATTILTNLLSLPSLHVCPALIETIGSQFAAVIASAELYSLDVSTDVSSETIAADLEAWLANGALLATSLAQLSSNQNLSKIQNLITDLIQSQSQGILAYNGVLSTVPSDLQDAQSVELALQAHLDADALARLVFQRLIKDVNQS
jgi:hypothetical protein